MTTNGEIVSCPGKQVIKKCIREVPCPQVQSKRKQDDLCPTTQMQCRRRPEKETGCRRPPKCAKRPQKLIEICPAGNAHSTSANGCPKCEENRIQKLECEVGYNMRFNWPVDWLLCESHRRIGESLNHETFPLSRAKRNRLWIVY